jgi:hypothetical protein
MMTIQMLTFVIATFCQFKNPALTKDQKMDCAEFMANCAIVQDGKTSNILVDDCKEKWVYLNGRR